MSVGKWNKSFYIVPHHRVTQSINVPLKVDTMFVMADFSSMSFPSPSWINSGSPRLKWSSYQFTLHNSPPHFTLQGKTYANMGWYAFINIFDTVSSALLLPCVYTGTQHSRLPSWWPNWQWRNPSNITSSSSPGINDWTIGTNGWLEALAS